MMNQENNLDEIDKIFIDYFKNEKVEPIPQCVQDSFNKTVNKIKKTHNYMNYLRKIAVIIISVGILSTSVVFAKDIIHFISSLFTNSTDAINTAVENNYVQEVDIDYVYDKNIGVTIDYVLLDDSNLDVSLIYKYIGNEAIDEIIIDDFIIKSDTGTILWERTKDIRNSLMEGFILSTSNNAVNIAENIYKDSLLITSKQFSSCNNIILEINSLKIKINGEYIVQNGSWILETKIDKNKLKREKIEYNIEKNEYIKNSLIEMTETSLKIQLDFDNDINQDLIKDIDNVTLSDTLGNEYKYKSLDLYNNKTLFLEYEISKFSENINNFILQMVINKDKVIELRFNR